MVLVTGSTGHLGNVLIRELLSRGEKVRAMILPGERIDSLEGLKVERIIGNVLNPDTIDRAMLGMELVYHLAGIISIVPGKNEIMRKVNVEGVQNVARAALRARVKRMVHVSSIHAFRREPHGVIIDENTPLALDAPSGSYDRTKAEGTRVLLEVVKEGLDAVIVCPTGIFGPHDFLGSHMGQVIKDFSKKKLHFLVDGAYDFVDVRDVARGIVLAGEKGRRGEIYILSGNQITVKELKKLVQDVSGVRSPGIVVPQRLAMFFANFIQRFYHLSGVKPRFTSYSLQTLSENSVFSCNKARNELGYSTHPVKETILDTLVWWKMHHRLHSRTTRSLKNKPSLIK